MARSAQEAERFREREARIVAAARETAEQQGWSAVTVRRLADAIGFSQPILYRHFPGGRDEIVGRVVVDGYTELAAALASPGRDAGDGDRARLLRGLIAGYLEFARAHPAVYEAMSTASTTVEFASDATPKALRDGFAIIEQAVGGRDARDCAVRAELLWSLLHGVSQLSAHGRLDDALDDARENAIVQLFAASTS